jgi:hypothetical protein
MSIFHGCPLFSTGQRAFVAGRTGIGKNGHFSVTQEFVQEQRLIGRANILPPLDAELGLVQEHDGDTIECVNLTGIKIVLCRSHVAFEYAPPAPPGQAHIAFGGVGSAADDLSGGHSGSGVRRWRDLGVTTSSMTRLANREESPELSRRL